MCIRRVAANNRKKNIDYLSIQYNILIGIIYRKKLVQSKYFERDRFIVSISKDYILLLIICILVIYVFDFQNTTITLKQAEFVFGKKITCIT